MTDQTEISWSDYTVNFWEGCQKVGPGCDNCYAEARDVRFTGGTHWGPGAARRKVKSGITKLQKINRNAPAFFKEYGRWPRVFCSSLSDIFDNAVDPDWRKEAFAALTVAPNVRPQLLTKRVGNVEDMIPATWRDGWPHWVGLMITVVNQEEADRDIPKLLDLKARFGIPWVGLSMEPLLEKVILHDRCNGHYFENWLSGVRWHDAPGMTNIERGIPKIDWVIVGGESGPNARPMHPEWLLSIIHQCKLAGVPVHFKQWGEWGPCDHLEPGVKFGCFNDAGHWVGDATRQFALQGRQIMLKVGKKRAGRYVDFKTWDQFPEALS